MRPSTEAILVVCLAAIIAGVSLYFYTPAPTDNPIALAPTVSPIPSPVPSMPLVQTQAVSFRILDTGMHAALASARKNYVAYAEEEFVKIWNMAHGTDGAALPKVDFSKEYVIGVFAGQKSTSGNSITVTSVTDTDGVRNVAITLTKPGPGCIVTQALTNPYQIVILPLSTASLTHTDNEVSTVCK